MATKKITDLTELTTAASGDVLPIVDIDLDLTKKITTTNLATSIGIDSKIAKYDGTTYDINALAAVTQAEYDALTPSSTTIYFII